MNKNRKLIKLKFNDNIQDLADFFKDNGYLFISNLFSQDEIMNVRQEICEVLASEKIIHGKNLLKAIPKSEPYSINSLQSHRVTEEVMKREIVHTLSYDKNLLKLLEGLLGKAIYSHPNKMFRVCFPSDTKSNYITPPHQDIYYIKGEKDTFTTWIPLGNYRPFEGSLKVIPGTHKKGLYSVSERQDKEFLRCAIANISEDEDWLLADCKMGDCLIMHSLTVHSGAQNNSKFLRLSIDYRFSALDGDINEEQLNPLYFTSDKSWEQISKGWSKNIPVAVIPKSLNILPKQTPLEKTLQKLSVFTKS